MMRNSLVFVLLAAACGGGSGGVGKPDIVETKKLVDLTTDEAGAVCDYTSDVEGGYGTSKMCGDGITITVKSRAACIASFDTFSTTCTATVADAEACAEAAADDLCKLLSEPKCAFAFQCPPGGAN